MTTFFRGRARLIAGAAAAVATLFVVALSQSELVRDAGVGPGSLVLDLGAGRGALTRALADAGARVRALELDPSALRQLETRFGADPSVEVVEGDATLVPLPVEPFAVVANLPFAAGTAILRRLLGDPRVPLTQLDAIVEWRLAAKRTAVWPSTLLGCAWGAWYELSLVRRVPRACFAPPPSVDAAVLRARRALGAAGRAGGGGRLRGAAAARVRRPGAARSSPPARPRPPRGPPARLRPARAAPRPRRAAVGGALRGGQICHVPPASSGISSPPRVTPLTTTSSEPIMKSTWISLSLIRGRSAGSAIGCA